MATTINLGKIRPYDAGEWSSTYAGGYDVLNIVTYGGGSFMSKVTANTYPLTDRTKWIPLTDGEKIIDAEEVTAQSLVELKVKIDALQKIINEMILNSVQIDNLDVVKTFNLFGSTNLILSGTAAPASAPDFIGQFYIKTTATKAAWIATNNTAVEDWLQIG